MISYLITEPKDFLQCHFAASPAHAVLTRAEATEKDIERYQSVLSDIAKLFGKTNQLGIDVFDRHLFSKYAIGLDKVPQAKRSYAAYLGDGYVKAIASLEGCA